MQERTGGQVGAKTRGSARCWLSKPNQPTQEPGSSSMCQQQHQRLGRRLPGWAASPGGLAAAAALEALPACCCPGKPADSGATVAQAQPLDQQQPWPAAGSRTAELAGGSGSKGGSAPSTPSHACALATVTPPTGAATHGSIGSSETAGPPACEGAPCCAAAAATTDGAAAPGACPQASLQRRVRSFQACVSLSPLVQSALLSLECDDSHPPPACLPAEGSAADGVGEPAAGLECTLAQLLALHLRAGYQQATESSVLACLWTLEALYSAWRSPATVCLGSYVKLLAAFSPELVRSLTRDWPATFAKLKAGLVAAQVELLRRLDWRLMLSVQSELQPCHVALFSGELSLASLCGTLRRHAAVLRGVVAPPSEGHGSCLSAATAEPCGSCTCHERLSPACKGAEVEQQLPAAQAEQRPEAEQGRPAKRRRVAT